MNSNKVLSKEHRGTDVTEAAATVKSDQITFKLNGTPVSVPKGWTVMQAAKREGVEVPHFCWHPGLSVAGVCRFCMVKVEGRRKLEIACNLQATEGMEVSTIDPEVQEAHKWALEFHLVNHPLDCPICDQAGECGLQDYYMKVGRYKSQMTRPKVLKPKALRVGGDLVLDTERCILCSRCVRFEEEVTKTDALGIFDRGDRAMIGIAPGKTINHNYTANLVDICPVGAFTSADFRFKQRVWFLTEKPATCPGCSTGCQINVFAKENTRRYFRLKPQTSETKAHWMCDTGRKMYQHVNKEERLLFASVLEGETRRRSSVDEIALLLSSQLEKTPANRVAVLLAPTYTNEEYDGVLNLFVKQLGVKQILQWREPTEKVDDFDGILRRGDHNANTNGLLKALNDAGLAAKPSNDFDQLAGKNFDLVIALAPEIPMNFPSLEDQLRHLSELPQVSVWGNWHQLQNYPFASLVPTLCFPEKRGTFINHDGQPTVLSSPFAPVVAHATDVISLCERIGELLSRRSQQANAKGF